MQHGGNKASTVNQGTRGTSGGKNKLELADEEAVALVFNGSTLAVMMATPSEIQDFACGFAITEGIVSSIDQIDEISLQRHELGIEAQIWLNSDRADVLADRRRASTGPVGCGLCGIESLEQASRPLPVLPISESKFTKRDLSNAAKELRTWQPLHDRTHAVHAAAFAMPEKGIVVAREDVGRHNALDKLVGALALNDVDPSDGAIIMTSRLSSELLQKCAFAGCGILLTVSPPTSLATQLAQKSRITIGQIPHRGYPKFYTHQTRILSEETHVA